MATAATGIFHFIHENHRSHDITFTWLKISLPFWEPISWREDIYDCCCRIPIKHRPVVISCSITCVLHTLVLIAYRLKWDKGSIMCWFSFKKNKKWEDRATGILLHAEKLNVSRHCITSQWQHEHEHKLRKHCWGTDRAIYNRWGLLQEEANQ